MQSCAATNAFDSGVDAKVHGCGIQPVHLQKRSRITEGVLRWQKEKRGRARPAGFESTQPALDDLNQ